MLTTISVQCRCLIILPKLVAMSFTKLARTALKRSETHFTSLMSVVFCNKKMQHHFISKVITVSCCEYQHQHYIQQIFGRARPECLSVTIYKNKYIFNNSSFAPFHLLSLLFLSFCSTFVCTFHQMLKLASSFCSFPKLTSKTTTCKQQTKQ